MDYCALFQTDFIELRRPSFSFPRVGHLFQWSNPFRTLNYHGRRQPAVIIIWTLLFIGYFPAMQSEQMNSQGEFWPSERNDPECATCQRERTLSVLKEEEIKHWRIETTKKQILDRLEMADRPPRVKTKDGHFHGLPPIAFQLPDNSQDEREIEPTRQIILFPEKIFRRNKNRDDSHANKTSTLKFHVTSEMNESSLHSAVLWTPETLLASSSNGTATAVNWHASDVTWTIDRQIELHHRSLSLPLNKSSVVHLGHEQPRPYLVVQLDPSIKRTSGESSGRVTRRKRQTTPMCSSTVTQCCRELLHIKFKDIGWNDWIAAPEGFDAYYCRGSCGSTPGTAASPHASTVQNLIARSRVPAAVRPHLAPCCAPTRLSPLIVYYSDESNVVKQRILPNMIVESCGCAL